MHNPNYLYNKYKNKLNKDNIIENRNLINKSEFIINNNNETYNNNYFWKIYYIDIFNFDNNQYGVCNYNPSQNSQNDIPQNKFTLDNNNNKKIIDDTNEPFFLKSDINEQEELNYIPTELLGDILMKNGKKYKKITINNLNFSIHFFDYENDISNIKNVYLPYKFVLYKLNSLYDENNNNSVDKYIPVELTKELISNNKVKSFIDLYNYNEGFYINHKTFNITFSFDKYLSFVIDDIQYLYDLFYEFFNGSITINRQREIKYIVQYEGNDDYQKLFNEYDTITDFILGNTSLNGFYVYNTLNLLSIDLIY